MTRERILPSACVLFCFSLLACLGPSSAALAGEIDKALLDSFTGGSTQNFFIEFKEQADLSGAYGIADWEARGRWVWDLLVSTAERSQKEAVAYLRSQGLSFKSIKVDNSLAVRHGSLQHALYLSSLPGVARVRAERIFPLPKPEPGILQEQVNAVEWNVADTKANEVWNAFGATGSGIVVANIDSGVLYSHPALSSQYRGNLGGGSFDHNYNWWDPSSVCGSPSSAPCDNNGHGTHTMGTMVGDDGAVNKIGMAPGARWFACKGCESSTCSETALLECADFVLAPWDLNHANPDPTRRPHVVNNSWGRGGGDAWYLRMVQAWVAAGIFPAFSAGNRGPECSSLGSPGDYQESFATAAHDVSRTIADFSSRGPSQFVGTRVKPNLSAPGVNVRSAWNDGSYHSISGTSMASPHTAGAVALLWCAVPSLIGQINDTFSVLENYADRTAPAGNCGAPGGEGLPNYTYGNGYLDILTAVAAMSTPAPYLTFHGASVDDAAGCLPNRQLEAGERALVVVELKNVGLLDATNISATLSSESPYVTIIDASAAFPDIPSGGTGGSLAPHFAVRVSDLAPPMAVVLFTLHIAADGFSGSSSFSLTVGGFAVDPLAPFDPIDATTGTPLNLGDDQASSRSLGFDFQYLGNTYNTVLVSSNGYITFGSYGASYWNRPIPDPSDPNNLIAPFWDDLNPGAGGNVYVLLSGVAPNRIFTVEWADVPHFPDVGNATFQVNLYEGSNEIVFQYIDVTFGDPSIDAGASATVGLEDASGTRGLLFSYNSPSLTDGLAVRFVPSRCTDFGVDRGTGHGYKRIDDPVSWEDARLACEGMDGHLATISSQQENDFVYGNLAQGLETSIWLGGTDEKAEGLWEWITGEPWTYENWAAGQPDNAGGSQHYLTFWAGHNGKWDDAWDATPFPFLCEWDCLDLDQDGYGSPASAACAYPEEDCDANDAAVHPGAVEGPYGDPLCYDGKDNDCDGYVDWEDANCNLLCTDNDGDGYGDPASPVCPYPLWDCDDMNPRVCPGCPELCGNGIDDNCDGHVDESWPCSATAVSSTTRGFENLHESSVTNSLSFLVIPIGAIALLRILRKRK